MIDGFFADLRHAIRLYLKTPGQTAMAVIALAAAMSLFSAMSGLWADLHLRTSPGVINDRGLISAGRHGEFPVASFSAQAVNELAAGSQTLHSISGASKFQWGPGLELDGQPLEGRVEPVLPGFFETVQPRMMLGQGLVRADFASDGPRVVVLSHEFWQSHFDGDPDIIGREIQLNEDNWRVTGVTHPAFRGMAAQAPALWIPYQRYAEAGQSGMPADLIEQAPFFSLVLRAQEGVGLAAIEQEIKSLVDDLPSAPMFGRPVAAEELFLMRGLVDNPQVLQAARRQVSLLLTAAVLIAVVAGVNVGIFLLARAPGRRRELALRQALGAGQRRLSMQLIIEAAVLVLLGCLLGFILSLWLAAAFKELPFLAQAEFSGKLVSLPALGLAALMTATLTILTALIPITLVRRGRLGEDSRQANVRVGAFQHAAGLVQLSLAGAVGAAALAFIAHLWLMEQRDLGLVAKDVTVIPVQLEQRSGRRSFPPQEAAAPLRDEIRNMLLELPGITAVGFMAPLPGQRMFAIAGYDIDGTEVNARVINIAPGTLDVLQIPLLHGRDFDHDDEPGVLVNRRFALDAWGETDVVGRYIHRGGNGASDDQGRILGVVGDVVFDHPDEAPGPMIFSPTQGFISLMSSIVLRGQADSAVLRDRVEPALQSVMEELYLGEIRPLSAQLAELTRQDRARAGITALLGAVIVLLSGFGFFSIQRFLIDSGQRETAIRMALGAGPRQVRRHALAQALRLGLPGLIIGSLLGLILVAWLGEDLISRSVSAPAIAMVTGLGLLTLMLIATLQPARQAGRLKPGELLSRD